MWVYNICACPLTLAEIFQNMLNVLMFVCCSMLHACLTSLMIFPAPELIGSSCPKAHGACIDHHNKWRCRDRPPETVATAVARKWWREPPALVQPLRGGSLHPPVDPGPWAPVNAGAEENAEAHDEKADLAGTNSSIHIHSHHVSEKS